MSWSSSVDSLSNDTNDSGRRMRQSSDKQKQRQHRKNHHREKIVGDKIVAAPIRNSEFQQKRDGDIAVLFFKNYCPYCRDFKPIWNRVARSVKERWSRDSAVYDEETKSLAKPPEIRKMDVVKFANVQKSIGFNTVPTIALYKRNQPVVFLTTTNRSLPNILKQVEDYYKRNRLPPSGEYLIGNEYGQYPPPEDVPPKIEKLKPEIVKQETPKHEIPKKSAPTPPPKIAERHSAKAVRAISGYSSRPDPEQKKKTMSPVAYSSTAYSAPAAQASVHKTSDEPVIRISKPSSAPTAATTATVADQVVNDIFARLLDKLVKNKGQL